MFQTADRCPISSMATSMIACRQRLTASASTALKPSFSPVLQAEGRIEIGAHQVVLEFGRLIEREDQLLPA